MSWRDILKDKYADNRWKDNLDEELAEREIRSRQTQVPLDDETAKAEKLDDNEPFEKKKVKVKCPQCKGDGCSHCDKKGYHESKSKGRGFTR